MNTTATCVSRIDIADENAPNTPVVLRIAFSGNASPNGKALTPVLSSYLLPKTAHHHHGHRHPINHRRPYRLHDQSSVAGATLCSVWPWSCLLLQPETYCRPSKRPQYPSLIIAIILCLLVIAVVQQQPRQLPTMFDDLWSEKFWCPPNLTWKHYEGGSPQKQLYYAFPTAVAILAARFVLESLLFRPFGLWACSRNRDQKNKAKVAIKFSESLWRLTFYFSASVYGIFVVLWNKPYARDSNQFLLGFPNHPVTTDEWWYYNIELGFYISLVITQFIDTKRKDFYQMLVHHVVTILLIFLSWTCNFHRVGCLVLAIHDVGDVPLEGAKLAKYCNKQRLADLIFAIFTLVWIYTRCYLLPTRVLYYTFVVAPQVLPFFGAYYVFNGLLGLLQIIHLVWTYLIINIAYDAIRNNGMRDLRSESEDSHED